MTKTIIDWVTLAVVTLGGGRAIMEYVRIGRWKKAELAATQLAALIEDDVLAFACHALDWGIGPIMVPVRYRVLLDKDLVEHNVAALELAVEPGLNYQTRNDPQGLLYRYCFDRLFNHFTFVHSMIERKLFSAADVASMKYYLDLIHDYPYARTKKSTEVFKDFIIKYEYKIFELRNAIAKAKSAPRWRRVMLGLVGAR